MKIEKKSTENCHFHSREISLYIAWACFHNGLSICDSQLMIFFCFSSTVRYSFLSDFNMVSLLADRKPSFMVMLSAAIDDAVDIVTRPVDGALAGTDDEVGLDWNGRPLIHAFIRVINDIKDLRCSCQK